MYFEGLNLSMTMRLGKITISGRALVKIIIYANINALSIFCRKSTQAPDALELSDGHVGNQEDHGDDYEVGPE